MNTDDLRWLLQTIKDPEAAERFVLAQYERGRIADHVMSEIARDRRWTGRAAIHVLTAGTGRSTECDVRQIRVVPQEGQVHERAILTAF